MDPRTHVLTDILIFLEIVIVERVNIHIFSPNFVIAIFLSNCNTKQKVRIIALKTKNHGASDAP